MLRESLDAVIDLVRSAEPSGDPHRSSEASTPSCPRPTSNSLNHRNTQALIRMSWSITALVGIAQHGAGGRGRTFYADKEEYPKPTIDAAIQYASENEHS